MRKKTGGLMLGLIVFQLFTACIPTSDQKNSGSLQGDITVSGAFALYPLMLSWADEFQKAHPAVNFDITSGGAGKGMEDILGKKVNIGMISREITAEELAQGVYPILVTKDAVFPMVNAQNPVVNALVDYGVSKDVLIKIFMTGEITTWGQVIGKPEITDEIHVYTRNETCGAAEIWAMYLGGQQADILGSGRFGDSGIIRALASDPLGIGYSNQIYAYGLGDIPPEGTMILPIDLNGNHLVDPDEVLGTRQKATTAVSSGLYPAPPARYLYLVTNGKPEGVVQEFLKWVLTDGQALVDRLGYVQLPNELLDASFQKIQ